MLLTTLLFGLIIISCSNENNNDNSNNESLLPSFFGLQKGRIFYYKGYDNISSCIESSLSNIGVDKTTYLTKDVYKVQLMVAGSIKDIFWFSVENKNLILNRRKNISKDRAATFIYKSQLRFINSDMFKSNENWQEDVITIDDTGKEVTEKHLINIISYSKITVPAGEFDAYELLYRVESEFNTDDKFRLKFAFVPDLGFIKWELPSFLTLKMNSTVVDCSNE